MLSSPSLGEEFHLKSDRKQVFKELRTESLDILNRLRSISEDAQFVSSVLEQSKALPVFPNLRCGAWYTDPAISRREPVYFKSTDGHMHNWSFNLRRPNLHLLPFIISHGGIVLVDSTRSGKRLPDALSKTIPIWCSVINRAIRKRNSSSTLVWDLDLYTPPASVSSSERDQIKAQLDGWVESLLNSSYVLPEITKPLRPFWITPASHSLPDVNTSSPFHPIICISASRLVSDALERRTPGYSYVQGAGDDHESWSKSLTPTLFWRHRAELISCNRDQIQSVVAAIVMSDSTSFERALCHGTRTHPPAIPIQKVGYRLIVSHLQRGFVSPENNVMGALFSQPYILMTAEACNPPSDGDRFLHVHVPEIINKTAKYQAIFLESILPESFTFIRTKLALGDSLVVAGQDADIVVGVVLTALAAFFDSEGNFSQEKMALTKESVKRRLEWILVDVPTANLPRWILRRVNEFLMSDKTYRRIKEKSRSTPAA